MKKLISFIYLIVSALIIFSGCGGSSGGGSNTNPQAPSAVITGDAYITSGESLDGSSSTDPQGDALTYTWTEVTATGVIFGNSTGETTTLEFSAWDNTSYQAAVEVTVRLTVSDGTNEDYADHNVVIYRTDYAYVKNGASGNGSAPDNAAGDINTAISYAETNSRSVVAVSAAAYNVDFDSATHVQMKAGISLTGGYSTNFAARDTSAYETIIADGSSEPANSWDNATCAVLFNDSSVDSATVLDGITVKGHTSGRLGQAVYITAGSPTIQNCTLISGNGLNSCCILIRFDASASILNNNISGLSTAEERVRGIFLFQTSSAAGPTLIQGNTISGGGQASSSIDAAPRAICLFSGFNATISNNSISGGNGYYTIGIYIEATSESIEISSNTLISGGNGTAESTGIYTLQSTVIDDNYIESGPGEQSSGIRAYTASADITDNVISIDSTSFCAGIWVYGSTPSISGNTIYSLSATRGWGIYEQDDSSDPSSVTGNNIYNCPWGLYYDNETTNIAADQVNTDGYFTDGTDVVEDGNTAYSGNTSIAP